MPLPCCEVAKSVPFYTDTFGFRVVERESAPQHRVILERYQVRIGLAENGGDPAQEGCVFEVDDIEAAFRELNGNGAAPGEIETKQRKNGTFSRTFFVVAPDGLCYMLAQPAVSP